MILRSDILTEPLKLAIRQHADDEFPKECCGFIAEGTYHRCSNVHDDPQNFFEMAPSDVLRSFEMGATCIVHSHTNLKRDPDGYLWHNCPSKEDMEAQIWDGRPWLIQGVEIWRHNSKVFHQPILWGDTLDPLPYIDRDFVHGVYDCFALARDWYLREKGISIPIFPRKERWWDTHENLIMNALSEQGFREIDRSEHATGDGVLFSFGTPKGSIMNHCGVYTGNGLFLHHFAGHKSKSSPLLRYPNPRFIRHVA